MIRDQQHQTLISLVWTKTVEVVEILFLIGALLIVFHFLIGLAALVGHFERFFSAPSWTWTELKVLVCLVDTMPSFV